LDGLKNAKRKRQVSYVIHRAAPDRIDYSVSAPGSGDLRGSVFAAPLAASPSLVSLELEDVAVGWLRIKPETV